MNREPLVESIEKSFSSGFSDSNKEADIITEDEENNNIIINNSD